MAPDQLGGHAELLGQLSHLDLVEVSEGLDDLTLGDLRRQLAAGELELEDLAHYFRSPESDKGTLETHPPDEASDRP